MDILMSEIMSSKSIWLAVFPSVLGFLIWWMKRIVLRLEKTMSKEEIKELVHDKMHHIEVNLDKHEDILLRFSEKLDRVLEKVSEK